MISDYLTFLANKYESDKGTVAPSTGHHGPRLHFTTVYSKFFEPIREKSLKILEIGVGSGPSLKMWYDFFPNSKIFAIDVVNQSHHENERVKTFVCDQSSRSNLEDVMKKIGNIDIIIDDGSHVVSHQQISLGFLFQFLNQEGQYWIEDLHTSDRSVWDGQKLYGYDMTVEPNHSTVEVIEDYMQTKLFKSPHLTWMENEYLTNNIKDVQMFELPRTMWGCNKLAYFRK